MTGPRKRKSDDKGKPKYFRIKSDVLKEIEKLAKENKVSLNNEVNIILEKYLEFYSRVEIEKASIIAPEILRFIIEKIEETDWKEKYGEVISGYIPPLLLKYEYAQNKEEDIIKFVFDKILKYCQAYDDFQIKPDKDKKKCLVFTHQKGRKWSSIMGFAYQKFLRELHLTSTIEKESENHLVIRINEKIFEDE